MKCIGFNGIQAWLQKQTQLIQCQQKKNVVGASEIFGQTLTVNIHKKKDHKEASLNFGIKKNTNEKIQIAAVIKVQVITYENIQSQYIQFIKHRSPLYIYVCLQFKCQRLIKGFQKKSFKNQESIINLDEQTLDGINRSLAEQNKKLSQYDDLKKIPNSAKNNLQSSSSSSFGSIEIKQSQHFYECNSLIYFTQKIFPAKCLFEICLSQFINKSINFNFQGFKLTFKKIKGQDGFKIKQHNLYLCKSCKNDITILGNLLQNMDLCLQDMQKNRNSKLSRKINFFLQKIISRRRKSKCIFNNWKKYKKYEVEKKQQEEKLIQQILMENQVNIQQIQVQKKVQEDKNSDKKL